jgi:hypothetical protein
MLLMMMMLLLSNKVIELAIIDSLMSAEQSGTMLDA